MTDDNNNRDNRGSNNFGGSYRQGGLEGFLNGLFNEFFANTPRSGHVIITPLPQQPHPQHPQIGGPGQEEPVQQEPVEDPDHIGWDDPRSVKKYLDRFVYGQEEAKQALSVAFSDYMTYNTVSHSLLVGPSGTGKTYMLSLLCDAAGIPFVKKSMANVTAAGYVDQSLSSILSEFQGGMMNPFGSSRGRKGIIFLDEFDKLAVVDTKGVRDTGFFPSKLQKELLAYYTGEVIQGIDTSSLMIVAAGAFHSSFGQKSLYDIIQARLGGSQAKVAETDLLNHLTDQDLVEFGFIPELVGRITRYAPLEPLDEEALYKILMEKEGSTISEVTQHFKRMGISLSFPEETLREVARQAVNGIGARGLDMVIKKLVEPYSFNRKDHRGETIEITANDVKEHFNRQALFKHKDNIEVDWDDPNSIVGYLDYYVVGQEQAKQDLALAFHLYHRRLKTGNENLPKANVLLIGPTGTGKTYMVDLLARKAKLPIAKSNLAGKVAASYAGERFADVFEQFSKKQRSGIVYIDEVDKVLMNPQDPLIKELIGYLENGEVAGRSTSEYLFILSGAFQQWYTAKLEEQTKKVGFDIGEAANSVVYGLGREDLEKKGVAYEILGRAPIITNTLSLTKDDMIEILHKPTSVVEGYKEHFASLEKQLVVESGALEALAEKAYQSKQGARMLVAAAQQLFRPYLMDVGKYKQQVKVTAKKARDLLGI